ncbi:MAG: hypothetical protein U0414_07505 [Polyangiaceae bacterium]
MPELPSSRPDSDASTLPSSGPPTIERAVLVCYRLFDVAEEIDLSALLELLRGKRARRASIADRNERMFHLSAAPVEVDLGTTRASSELASLGEVRARAQFFHYGIVSISFEVALPPRSLDAYAEIAGAVLESTELTSAARALVDDVDAYARAAYQRPRRDDDFETFTVFFAEELGGGARADAILAWDGLGKLLAGETAPGKLDARQRHELRDFAYAYLEDDLVVIDFNAALVVEPSGARDIPLLLEFANAQLLALRNYDRALDGDMRRIYDELEKLERRKPLRKRRYDELAHEVIRRSVEVREFSDLIGNSIKVTGDFYLARTYRGALRRLRVADWQESIANKLALASEVYSLLKGELEHARSFFLEVLVVLLILLEVVLVFVGH